MMGSDRFTPHKKMYKSVLRSVMNDTPVTLTWVPFIGFRIGAFEYFFAFSFDKNLQDSFAVKLLIFGGVIRLNILWELVKQWSSRIDPHLRHFPYSVDAGYSPLSAYELSCCCWHSTTHHANQTQTADCDVHSIYIVKPLFNFLRREPNHWRNHGKSKSTNLKTTRSNRRWWREKVKPGIQLSADSQMLNTT